MSRNPGLSALQQRRLHRVSGRLILQCDQRHRPAVAIGVGAEPEQRDVPPGHQRIERGLAGRSGASMPASRTSRPSASNSVRPSMTLLTCPSANGSPVQAASSAARAATVCSKASPQANATPVRTESLPRTPA